MNLGAGCYGGTQKVDLSLVERGFRSSDSEDQHWAYLAIEKLCYCTDLLDPAYIESVFPQLLDETTSEDKDASEFASRAIGALSREPDLLTPDQIAQAYEKAMLNLQSTNFEYRRRGVNLLHDLIHQLGSASRKEAIAWLLHSFEEWQQSNELEWNEYERELAASGTTKQRFQHQAIQALLGNCEHIQNEAQALTAYDLLIVAFENQGLDFRVLPAIAGLVRILPSLQRQEAINLIVASVSDERSWYSVGSGIVRPANYASDALFFLAPVLDKDELQQALNAIESQEWSEEEDQVFEKTRQALKERIPGSTT